MTSAIHGTSGLEKNGSSVARTLRPGGNDSAVIITSSDSIEARETHFDDRLSVSSENKDENVNAMLDSKEERDVAVIAE